MKHITTLFKWKAVQQQRRWLMHQYTFMKKRDQHYQYQRDHWREHRFTYLCGTFSAFGEWRVVYIFCAHTLN